MKGQTLGAFIKLVIFAVVTIFVTSMLAFTIANGSIGDTVNYRADFADVTGLVKGDDVRVAGVRVGQVKSIEIADRTKARVTFALRRDIPFRESTLAKIRYRNLVGQRYLEIAEGPGNDRKLPPGSLLPLSNTTSALDLTALFNGFRPLFRALSPGDVNKLSYEIIATLQGEGGTLDSLVTSTASLTNTLADRDLVIGSVITNMTKVLETVDQRDEGLSELIVQLQRLVTGLAGDRQTLSQAIGGVSRLASSTAGLLEEIRPPLPRDLDYLSRVSQTLATTTNADGQITLEEFLRRFPDKLNTIIRTATYGSWFNFYLCDFDYMTHGQLSAVRGHSPGVACDAP